MAPINGASGFGVIGLGDADSLSGADTIFGFTATDALAPAGPRGGGDPFLDDSVGDFDAALGYALAFQSLLAEAWKSEPSILLRHLDRDGSCAPVDSADGRDTISAGDDAVTPLDAPPDMVMDDLSAPDAGMAGAWAGGDADISFADAAISGADLFGLSSTRPRASAA